MNNWKSESQLLQNLSDCGLLCSQSMADGSLALFDFSSRNRNILVEQERPVFVKIGLDEHRKEALHLEAAVYSDSQFGKSLDGTWRFLPTLIHCDVNEGVLITKGLSNNTSLMEILMEPASYNQERAGKRMGEALASVQRTPYAGSETDHGRFAPWPFSLGVPEKEAYVHFSTGAQEIIRLIQRNQDYVSHLEQLKNNWQCDVIMHNDFKPDNVLFTLDAEGNPDKPKIIDWEMSGWGDRHWDVGTLWAAVLKVWIDGVERPGEPDMNPTRNVNELFAFNQSFWNSYASCLPSGTSKEVLLRTVQHAGVGLLKTAVEITEMMSTPNRTHLLYLQVSHNLIIRPAQAAKALLGL